MHCFAQIQTLSNNDNLSLPLCRHASALVRATTSRLLTILVTTAGADRLLGPRANKAFRKQVISAAANLLDDGSLEARYGICVNCCQVT
jgi:hypothetical protein